METPLPPASTAPSDADQRTWAMIAHLSTFAGHLIPFGHIIAPLVIWLIKKDTMPFVNEQGKEAINFQITMTFAFIVAGLLVFVLVGFVLLPIFWLFDVIVVVIAAIKAKEGVSYRYPLCLRLLN